MSFWGKGILDSEGVGGWDPRAKLSKKQRSRQWWGRWEQRGDKEKTEIEGEQKWPPFPFRESNQIPLIAHYLKRLSGAVMRLHAGLRLRDFLVYRCWRVLQLTGWAKSRREG